MGLRTSATLAETAALDLAARGRGLFGHRERQIDRVIGSFVGRALDVPSGGVLPAEVREELGHRIDGIIDALEVYVARAGDRSNSRSLHDTGVVKHIYALREVQQHLLQTSHVLSVPDRVQQRHAGERQQNRHGNTR